MKNTTA